MSGTVELHRVPNDPYYSSVSSWGQIEDDLWGLKKIDFERAWDITQGENVIVAVIDTGLFIEHPEITENVWINKNEIPGNGIDDDNNGYIDDVNGWNFEEHSNNYATGLATVHTLPVLLPQLVITILA